MTRIAYLLGCWWFVAMVQTSDGQCVRLPDGRWSCPPAPAEPGASPTAMDVRIKCATSAGSGTSVARLAGGGTAIVTSHHVVRDQSHIEVHSGTGESAAARVLAVDAANDLALLGVDRRWPTAPLGEEVAVGTAVQFRAYDAGERFRKYFGNVLSEYSEPGGVGGFLASGRSVPGNSGGGVYSRGKLVGVVWGSPSGATAFVRVGPVRRLLGRVAKRRREPLAPLPESPRRIAPQEPNSKPLSVCECDERLERLEAKLEAQLARLQPPVAAPPATAIDRLDWLQLAAAAVGVSGPVGLGVMAAGLLVARRMNPQRRGPERLRASNVATQKAPATKAPPRDNYHYAWNEHQQRAVPVAVDSPPAEPQVIETNHYVPYETSHFQNAYTWASGQVARKLPAAVETLHMLDSLIQQQMNGSEK